MIGNNSKTLTPLVLSCLLMMGRTLVRARAVRKHVDHMITLGKRGDLHARRQAMGWMYDKQLVHSLFDAAPERYGDRNGGYCRVLRTVARQGDNAKMAIIELV